MTQLSMQFDKPLLSGNLNGVNWRSLTMVGSAQSKMTRLMLSRHNDYRKHHGFEPVGLAEMIRAKYEMTLFEWNKKKFTPLAYYEAISSYRNNKRVL